MAMESGAVRTCWSFSHDPSVAPTQHKVGVGGRVAMRS